MKPFNISIKKKLKFTKLTPLIQVDIIHLIYEEITHFNFHHTTL
jgi:hypothetical protein